MLSSRSGTLAHCPGRYEGMLCSPNPGGRPIRYAHCEHPSLVSTFALVDLCSISPEVNLRWRRCSRLRDRCWRCRRDRRCRGHRGWRLACSQEQGHQDEQREKQNFFHDLHPTSVVITGLAIRFVFRITNAPSSRTANSTLGALSLARWVLARLAQRYRRCGRSRR